MAHTLRWGILATGLIADLQTADLLRAGLTVTAVGSRTQASADRFGERYGIPHRHGSYEALCADPSVDIIYVATPHPMHVDNAVMALEAGKHVLVEKAFTVNAAEAQRIVAAATAGKRFAMEAMWTRFLPTMVRAMEIVRGGGIGTPRVLIADHNQYLPYDGHERLHEPELGGGAILDLGIYPLSLANRVFGAPARITARGTLTNLGVDELAAIILEYSSGAQSSIHTGFLTPGPNVASIIGDAGRIDIDSVWYTQTSFTHRDQQGAVVERYTETIEGRGMQYQALEVERCIGAGLLESPVMPLSETLSIMETMDEIRRQIGVVYPSER
jgi:predicted dehydrogenase